MTGRFVLPTRCLAAAFITVLAVIGCGGGGGGNSASSDSASGAAVRVAGLVYGTPSVVTDAAGKQTVAVDILTQEGKATVTTGALTASQIAAIKSNLVQGNLVDWIPGESFKNAVVPTDPTTTFNVILAKGNKTAAQFVASKYGPEVTALNKVAGPRIAAGWVYGKTDSSLTVGDGHVLTKDISGRAYSTPIKRYEETFSVSPNVHVFNVNTDEYTKSAESDFKSIPVTADYSHGTTSRQAVYVLFDRNYLEMANAKVVAIWYFTPKSTSDGLPAHEIPVDSTWLATMGNDPVSGKPYSSLKYGKPDSAPYNRSTEPFAIVKDTMFSVGDNEVASYVFKADMGYPNDPSKWKIIRVDAGWPGVGYQYFKNMELVGIDPRSVTDIWLTHGHGDHYGTAVEHLRMMDNASKPVTLWGPAEDTFGVTKDLQGNSWNIAGALPASETVIRARTTKTYTYDQWYDYGNVKIYVTWSPGHTAGTTNMVFKVKNPDDGKFYTFGYHGGYGFNGLYTPTAANGWLRLGFQHGFSYLQQMFSADFVAAQHANQYPFLEVYQALKAYNRDPANASKQLTMLDALTSSVADSAVVNGKPLMSEFLNQLEKRRSVVSYKASDAYSSSYKSIETSGPFKPGRENGLSAVSAKILDDGKIIQGFNKYMNKNPKIPLLANGVANNTDSYTHDPDGYYVQVYIDVMDSTYHGYLPESFTQFSPGMNATITYQGGPIESIHAATGTYHPPEILRTQRLGSLAEAQAVLATITKGSTYTIQLNKASEIVVPSDVTKTFK